MEESIFLRLFSLLSGLDWLTVLTLFVVALFYFLAPVLRYSMSNRSWILGSLWTLVLKLGLGFCKVAWFCLEQWDTVGGFTPWGNQGQGFGARGFTALPGSQHSTTARMAEIGLPPLEAGLFVLALFCFVFWLTGLRRREMPPPD